MQMHIHILALDTISHEFHRTLWIRESIVCKYAGYGEPAAAAAAAVPMQRSAGRWSGNKNKAAMWRRAMRCDGTAICHPSIWRECLPPRPETRDSPPTPKPEIDTEDEPLCIDARHDRINTRYICQSMKFICIYLCVCEVHRKIGKKSTDCILWRTRLLLIA